MLDGLIIIFTLLFLVIQVIVSCCLSFVVAKSKKAGGMVVSNFWCDGTPHFLLAFTAIMLLCAVKTGDKLILMLPIVLSMCLLFHMHVLYYDGEKMNHYSFLFRKNICKAFSVDGKAVVVDFEDKKQMVRLSNRKLQKLAPYLEFDNTMEKGVWK